jgi:hypothetical protein
VCRLLVYDLFILRKNKDIAGFLFVALILCFFGLRILPMVTEIRRMRSAFDPNDPSLQVRLDNQKNSKDIWHKTFGAGIGHAGSKAQRYLPNAFLSSSPQNSWYVMIWAEMSGARKTAQRT